MQVGNGWLSVLILKRTSLSVRSERSELSESSESSEECPRL